MKDAGLKPGATYAAFGFEQGGELRMARAETGREEKRRGEDEKKGAGGWNERASQMLRTGMGRAAITA